MPPFTSRLSRISRAVRSQRVSSPAASGSPLGSTNAGESGACGSPSWRRSSTQRRASGTSGQVGDARAPRSSAGVAPPASSDSHSRDWRADQRLAQEQLAQERQLVVGRLAGERSGEAVAAVDARR